MTIQFEKIFTKILEEELSKELGPALSRIEGRLCDIIQRCKEMTDEASRTSQSSGSPRECEMEVPLESSTMILPEDSDWIETGGLPNFLTEDWEAILHAPSQSQANDSGVSIGGQGGFLDQFVYRTLQGLDFPSAQM